MTKPMNKNEREHISLVKRFPCIICDEWAFEPGQLISNGGRNIEYHHICDTGRRLGHMFGLPLCTEHHRGDKGFSGKDRSAWDKSLNNQLVLMNKVYAVLGKEPPVYQSKVIKRNDIDN